MPDARCTRGLMCNGRRSAHAYRAAENIRHPLRNGFTAYNVLSPAIGFLATVAAQDLLRNLTPAPRCQDHTSLPYASTALVSRSCRVHRIPVPRS